MPRVCGSVHSRWLADWPRTISNTLGRAAATNAALGVLSFGRRRCRIRRILHDFHLLQRNAVLTGHSHDVVVKLSRKLSRKKSRASSASIHKALAAGRVSGKAWAVPGADSIAKKRGRGPSFRIRRAMRSEGTELALGPRLWFDRTCRANIPLAQRQLF